MSLRAFLSILMASVSAPALAADDADSPSQPDITVYGRGIDLIGVASSGSEGVVGYRDLEQRPLLRVGELVETVPGVIATQHSGTGKANQYFLRGFNLDHGTDFAGFVDGIPVNMRSHGHGQGYLDLNFLIPELVERIDYGKGPYAADAGDFSAAGTIRFRTYDRLPAPIVQATAGEDGYYRALAAGSAAVGGGDLLVGIEGTASNGPWVLDEDFRKVAGQLKYGFGPDDARWTLNVTGYDAHWTSTDQIPLRAVESGQIPRLGFIDPFLGGRTRRVSLGLNGELGSARVSLFALHYAFRLTSNFTYFLDDPVNGDEFQQRDRRWVFGGAAEKSWEGSLLGVPARLRLGAQGRTDLIGRVGLYHSVAGRQAGTIRQDKVDEYSFGLFAEAVVQPSDRLRTVFGLRSDVFGYRVRDALIAANGGRGHDGQLSPKVAIAWRAAGHLELYADYGESFHSNDARGAATRVDPATGGPATPVPLLVRARGAELGARVETGRFNAALALFGLDLGSELVFVGDAGTTEPNPGARRYGVELSGFWRPVGWLAFDGSVALTHARFRGAGAEDRIPNSVSNVIAGGMTLDLPGGLAGAIRVRHFGAAPLIEDGSVRSRPTTLVNLGMNYTLGRVRLGADLYNLFDAKDADITYFYESRLAGEAQAVEDIHFHPVEPRELRVTLRYTL